MAAGFDECECEGMGAKIGIGWKWMMVDEIGGRDEYLSRCFLFAICSWEFVVNVW